jgi:hypothetical protein
MVNGAMFTFLAIGSYLVTKLLNLLFLFSEEKNHEYMNL